MAVVPGWSEGPDSEPRDSGFALRTPRNDGRLTPPARSSLHLAKTDAVAVALAPAAHDQGITIFQERASEAAGNSTGSVPFRLISSRLPHLSSVITHCAMAMARRARPGIHGHEPGLWISGLAASRRPGMTTGETTACSDRTASRGRSSSRHNRPAASLSSRHGR
jgi:hypothetical protein